MPVLLQTCVSFLRRQWRLIAILIAIGIVAVAFSLIWPSEQLRLYVVAAASGITVLLVTTAPLFERQYTWVLVLGGAFLTAWVSGYTSLDILNKDKQISALKQEVLERDYRIEVLKDYFTQLFPNLSPAEKSEALLKGGALANARLQEALHRREVRFSYDAVRDLTGILAKLEKNNGHALYFSGEADFHRRTRDEGETQFNLYTEEEKRLAPRFRKSDTSAAACRNPEGFCRERTAWVYDILANEVYKKALAVGKTGGNPSGLMKKALSYVCNVEILYGDFTQLIPTSTLKKAIEKELPGKTCRAATRADLFGPAPFAPSVVNAKK